MSIKPRPVLFFLLNEQRGFKHKGGGFVEILIFVIEMGRIEFGRGGGNLVHMTRVFFSGNSKFPCTVNISPYVSRKQSGISTGMFKLGCTNNGAYSLSLRFF